MKTSTHINAHTINPLCACIIMFGLLVDYLLRAACSLLRVFPQIIFLYDMFNVRTKAAGGQSDSQHDKNSAVIPSM